MSPDRNLAEILAHRMRSGAPIPVPLTLSILHQVCNALDYAHNLRDAAGQPTPMIHGDVSPAHIYLGEGGQATLVARTTQHGTFAYMAPEYVMNGVLDPRADLFAIGVVAHEMLTNRPLFATGNDRETLDRVCTLPVPAPSTLNPQVPPDVDNIVLMALARDPAYRWQHAAMMRDWLGGVAQRLGLELTPAHQQAWAELIAVPAEPAPGAPAPAPGAPVPAPGAPGAAAPAAAEPVAAESGKGAPPRDPNLWADDPDDATRIEAFDPERFKAEVGESEPAPASSPGAAAAPVSSPVPASGPSPASAPASAAAPAPGAPRPSAPSAAPARALVPTPAPAPAPVAARAAAPAPGPRAPAPAPGPRTPAPAPVASTLPAPAPSSPRVPGSAPGPVGLGSPAPPVLPPAPGPDPAPASPVPAAPPSAAFDPDLGPEPTQIGAMPLITFGDEPLLALVGEKNAARPAALPEPIATFLPEPEPRLDRNKRLALIAIAVVVVIVVIVLVAR